MVITGAILDERFENREAVGAYITSLGGSFKNSVGKGTSWLVVGTSELALLMPGLLDVTARNVLPFCTARHFSVLCCTAVQLGGMTQT